MVWAGTVAGLIAGYQSRRAERTLITTPISYKRSRRWHLF
jgi:1-aminocyclopropane-1-carboxylate deaminase/D-cysteine desulfhydrase-like pyridoxal-dependent ACC family enzyme